MYAWTRRARVVFKGAVGPVVSRCAIASVRANQVDAQAFVKAGRGRSAVIDVGLAILACIAGQAEALEGVDLRLDTRGAVLAGVGRTGVKYGLAVLACVTVEAGAGVAVEVGGRAEAAVHTGN